MKLPTIREIRGTLYELGRGPNKIANSLRRRKITGTSKADSCPIACYLNKQFPDTYAYVDEDIIAVANKKLDNSLVCSIVKVYRIRVGGVVFAPSSTITKFISNFDDNKYPFLKEKK